MAPDLHEAVARTPKHVVRQTLWVLQQYRAYYGNTSEWTIYAYKPVVGEVSWLLWLLYSFLSIGILMLNGIMCYRIYKRSLFHLNPPIYSYLMNVGVVNCLVAVFILPMHLYANLRAFWLLGEALCYALPLIYALPEHVSMLSFLLLVVDRYRLLHNPICRPFPRFVSLASTWIISFCVALPFSLYIKYYDISHLSAILHYEPVSIGFCSLQEEQQRQIHEYIRALLAIMYAIPLCVITALFAKTKADLDRLFGTSKSRYPDEEQRVDGEATPQTAIQSPTKTPNYSPMSDRSALTTRIASAVAQEQKTSRFLTVRSAAPLRSLAVDAFEAASIMAGESNHNDVQSLYGSFERRQQTLLVYTISAFGIAWLPMNVLGVFNPSIDEDVNTAPVLDMAYLILVWVGFLSALSTPIFASLLMTSNNEEGGGRLIGSSFSYHELRHRLSSYWLGRQASSDQSPNTNAVPRTPTHGSSMNLNELTMTTRLSARASFGSRNNMEADAKGERLVPGHSHMCECDRCLRLLATRLKVDEMQCKRKEKEDRTGTEIEAKAESDNCENLAIVVPKLYGTSD